MSIYRTNEAKKSTIDTINGCINALNNEPGLAYKIGTLTLDHITKYLAEYKAIIEREIKENNVV